MNRSVSRDNDDRTRAAIIDAAEEFFGRDGIAATSLRSIQRAAGQKNSSAIQYHFGNKSNLVQAIISLRRAEIDILTGDALVDALVKEGGPENIPLRTLLRIGWRPIFDKKNKRGERIYSLFLRAVLVDFNYHQNWFSVETLGRNAGVISQLMRQRSPCSDEMFYFRARTLQQYFHHAVAEYDAMAAAGATEMSEDDFFGEVTNMIASAWVAPSDRS